MTQALTVAEKILFHLFQYLKSEDKYEVPFDVTQDGIAQSCGISRAHAAIELKKLRESDQLIEKLSHVKKAKSRRKVYFLTQDGKTKAAKIADHVRSENVETGVDPARISQGTGPAKRAKRHTSAIPQPKLFFGRENELKTLHALAEDDSTELVLLTGLGGIGKTALMSKFARESKSSVFWFSMSEWETEFSLLKAMGNFLEDSGDNRLANYLKSDRTDLGEIGYLLGESLSENRRILILDDADKVPRLNAIVKMIVQNSGPNKVFMAGEARPAVVDEMKVTGKTVIEVAVAGLEQSAARELLKIRGITGEKADQLCQLTDCHPLLLGLVPSNDESLAKVELSNFVKGTLLKELPARDMAIVEKCAVMRKPFSPNYLPRDERHILQLPIFFHMSDNYGMHEMARRIIVDQIPVAEKSEYHSQAADHFLHERSLPERLYHLAHSGRFMEAEMLIHSHSDDLIAAESPQNLLDEVGLIPSRVSKYTYSVKLLAARSTALLGDEKRAIDSLIKMAESERGEKRAEILLQLAERPLERSARKKVFSEMESLLEDRGISMGVRSKIAFSLASMKFSRGELDECEEYAGKGIAIAANSFSLDTISSLNRLMGQILVLKEKYPKAITFLGQTAPSFTGSYRPLYHRLMAKSMIETGKMEDAKTNLEASVKVAEESGLFKELGESLMSLCNLRFAAEDIEGAAESAYRCIEVSSSIGDKNTLGIAYAALSSIESKRGNQKEAAENKAVAKSISKELGIPISFDPAQK